jgi:signal transduction histidine kinase
MLAAPDRDPPVEVAVDEVELAQVVGNLLDNALLHGQPPVQVHVDRVGPSGGCKCRTLVQA